MIGWVLGLLGFATYPRRAYDVYAILGDPCSQPIWTWDCWINDVVPLLDPVFAAGRGSPKVRSTQHVGATPTSKDLLKFGSLGWATESHAKWVHGSPTNANESGGWTLVETQIVTPSLGQCEREDLPPDVYFGFANFKLQPLINPVIVLAVAADLQQHGLLAAQTACDGLARITTASVAGYQQRPWGIPTGRILVAYENVIDGLVSGSLFRPLWYDRESVELEILDGEWESRIQRTTP